MTTPEHEPFGAPAHGGAGTAYAPELFGGMSTFPKGWEPPIDFLDFPHLEEIQHDLMSHPVGMCAVHGYDASPDWDHLLDCGQEPGDPHQRLRWKHTREAFDSIKPFLKGREEMLGRYKKQRNYQATLAQFQKRDPLYERTMEVMEQLMDELPQVVKELAMPTLARDFGPFLRLYAELRQVAELIENHGHNKKRREHHRERAGDSGNGPARPSGSESERKSQQEERRALVARVKAGGAREGDLLRYLELCGV